MLTENATEEAALEILSDLGYEAEHGPNIAHDGSNPERDSYSDVVLRGRVERALRLFNPTLPESAREEAMKKVLRFDHPETIHNNESFHRLLVDGIEVEYRTKRRIKGNRAWLIDFEHPENNDFLAVNQFTVIEGDKHRRPDIVIFINGLPISIIELKDPTEEKATVRSAFNQLQTYLNELGTIFRFNEILVISDGIEARAGTISSDFQRFMPWKKISDERFPEGMPQQEVLLRGMFDKKRLVDIIRNFVVFEKDKEQKATGVTKKLAAYHQYQAVSKAVESTATATRESGDRRAGVVWHTQGSGKSLSMVFYAGKLVRESELRNPTIVMLTDRNDLDDQLLTTFKNCKSLLRQTPKKAQSRNELKELLSVSSGGVIFTTIQKFFPEAKGKSYPKLSDRKNIVVIADEAHRSQYDFIDGFARHMRDALPNATYIGFTGTPIETGDKNTRAVFGEYVDVYDFKQAVDDGATVPIVYEGRLVKIKIKDEKARDLDRAFEEVTRDLEQTRQEKLKTSWAKLEAIVGNPERIKTIAKDIVSHFEERQETLEGKGMIVGMSRRICVDLYDEIVKLRPEWHNKSDDKGLLKVVMTGSATDPVEWQQHIRNKERRDGLADVFKDPSSPVKLVIVRDMWLTGFDVPSLHTMYLDKPMQGHGLMQAIARVNRVYKDKPGGLIVDYLGVAHELKRAIAEYTATGAAGEPAIEQSEVVAVMREKYEVVRDIFSKFDYQKYFSAGANDQMRMLIKAEEYILGLPDGTKRLRQHVTELSKAFALAVPHEDALAIKDEVGFFQAVKARLTKLEQSEGTSDEELNTAIRQIVSGAVSSDEVIDIFDAAGLKKPDVSILSDDFLHEVKGLEHKRVALELLERLLRDQIKTREKRNIVEAKTFSEMLDAALKRYQARSVEAAQVIEELIELAKDIRKSEERREESDLSDEELAFYDALADNESAREVLGDDKLKIIAADVLRIVKENATIDWTVREQVQARLRVLVKQALNKYGYPPDLQKAATEVVLKQAALLSEEWATA